MADRVGAVATDLNLNLNSVRAQKARLSALLGRPPVRFLTAGLIVVLATAGAYLLARSLAAGWLALAIAVLSLLLLLWYQGELQRLPAAAGSIDGMLEAGLLGILPTAPGRLTPKTLAGCLSRTSGGLFLAARFGIAPSLLEQTASDNPADLAAVWREADSLRLLSGASELSALCVSVAMLRVNPVVKGVIARLQLDEGDLLAAVRWYAYLNRLVYDYHRPVYDGGLARDWSFGYTPLLERFGRPLGVRGRRDLAAAHQVASHQKLIEQLLAVLGQSDRRAAAVVGPLGSGKTKMVEVFAARLLDAADQSVPDRLRFNQVVSLDAASLIARAKGRGDLEQLVGALLVEAYRAKNVIVCLDDAQLFLEDGIGSVDLSKLLNPVLEAGNLPMILIMDEQRWLQIGRRNPALAAAISRLNLGEPSDDEMLDIIFSQLTILEFKRHVTYMFQAVREAVRLSRRYLRDLALPGGAIKLLESSAALADSGLVTAASVQTALEESTGVKVAPVDSAAEKQKLLKLEELIHQRMVNQTQAVAAVSDALRRARSGVRNPDRPVGTFLMLGPTGVGKTELSKALAEVYFGGEDRLVRLDMNEFSGAGDTARLIDAGETNGFSLAAQISKQPFSVVLLDEIEKAHDAVRSLLLQMIDEGVLRDSGNRQISFRDAIIIATSNAGADTIRQLVEAGQQPERFGDQLVNQLISSGQFRPEFINRFDDVIIFKPLGKDELRQVVDLILAGINRNLALQKISLRLADDAKDWLIEQGYDARLGARPLRRVVQRNVENLVAKKILSGGAAPGSVIEVKSSDLLEP